MMLPNYTADSGILKSALSLYITLVYVFTQDAFVRTVKYI